MRTTLRLVSFALLVAAGALLAGCPDNDPKKPTTPSGSTSAAVSATPPASSGGSGW